MKLNKISFTAIAASLLTLVSVSAASADYGIIPAPQKLTPAEGFFNLKNRAVVSVEANDQLFGEVANDMIAQLALTTGFNITLAPECGKNNILLRKVDGMADEAYRLNISTKQVVIEASTAHGAFYGIQTLYQLLPPQIYGNQKAKGIKWQAPCCLIEDAPHFPYRGLMYDSGRFFFPKEDVMKMIDLMSMHKMNVFHWHLTEDQGWRIEIKKYPRLTEVGAWRKETAGYENNPQPDGTPHGGFYSQDDVREVVEYARHRFVTVVPEIELPGHSTAAITAYPELSCFPDRPYEVLTTWGIKKDVYCPNAATFTFLEDVFTELFDLFPSKYYHIGGDECPRESWQESKYVQDFMKVMDFENEDQVQIFFVQRMEKFLREKGGKTVIGWDEILDGGAVDQTIVMSYRGHAPAARAISRNMYTVLAPNRWCYLDNDQSQVDNDLNIFMPLRKVYNYFPTIDSLPEKSAKYILGVQGCMWTEHIRNGKEGEYMAYPRAAALAETAWCNEPDKDWDSFRVRMKKEFARLDIKSVNYCRSYYDVLFGYDPKLAFPRSVELLLDDPDATIHYTTDGSVPTVLSKVYTSPIEVEKGTTLRACGFNAKGKQTGKETKITF